MNLLNTSVKHGAAMLPRIPDRPCVGAEVGVLRGKLSDFLLARRPQLRLLMVDRWAMADGDARKWAEEHQEPCAQQEQADIEDHYATAVGIAGRHQGRGEVIRADSLDAARDVPDGSLDFVFIDADHRYEAVVADIAAWLPKVRPGGWIGGHDYAVAGFGGDVKRAVDEAAKRHGWRLELDTFYTWFAEIPGVSQ